MLEPRQIIEESERAISVQWSDDSASEYSAAQLRKACPCAGCVNEWTGEKTLDENSVADDLSFSHITVVGRYALNFHFSDGHDTGIYSFAYLRRLA